MQRQGVERSLGEHRKNIERYAKAYREKGASWFFSRTETRGQCYKVTEEKLGTIQEKLDKGYSINTAGMLGVPVTRFEACESIQGGGVAETMLVMGRTSVGRMDK